jgi:hypothetical protein
MLGDGDFGIVGGRYRQRPGPAHLLDADRIGAQQCCIAAGLDQRAMEREVEAAIGLAVVRRGFHLGHHAADARVVLRRRLDAGDRRRLGLEDGPELVELPHIGARQGADRAPRPAGSRHQTGLLEADHRLAQRGAADAQPARQIVLDDPRTGAHASIEDQSLDVLLHTRGQRRLLNSFAQRPRDMNQLIHARHVTIRSAVDVNRRRRSSSVVRRRKLDKHRASSDYPRRGSLEGATGCEIAGTNGQPVPEDLIGPFRDSTALLRDPPALRQRFAQDGYVFPARRPAS